MFQNVAGLMKARTAWRTLLTRLRERLAGLDNKNSPAGSGYNLLS
jgi:hypothetical protein